MSEISKHRLIDGDKLKDQIKARLSKVPGYRGEATELSDPFHRGKATSYENVLRDIYYLPSDQGEATRMREALERIKKIATDDQQAKLPNPLWANLIIAITDQALSFHTEEQQKESPETMSFTEWCRVMEAEDGEFHGIPLIFKWSMYGEYLERIGIHAGNTGIQKARSIDEWHEDYGDVLWWAFPIEEPPYVGSPLDNDWPGYHTHWTGITIPGITEER
ncbi:hypothetical protein [Cohnella herbarum]|uniref:Uncharacterized protein n=1 Tax=Cohnella herbarum TaxID=2728023 RepID=A0A7Z2VS20_9BACL|nr:hypothetical protein [Cohnella herbarum]QJD87885.1 hypothetical protein HH215_34975 [Cohnella herbarum]